MLMIHVKPARQCRPSVEAIWQRREDSAPRPAEPAPDDGLSSAIYIMSTPATAHFDRLRASAGSVGSCSVNISGPPGWPPPRSDIDDQRSHQHPASYVHAAARLR